MTRAERLASLLELYPVPDETVSEEQHDAFHGLDVRARTGADLYRELTALRTLNYFCDSAWHLERETAIAHELGSRGRKR